MLKEQTFAVLEKASGVAPDKVLHKLESIIAPSDIGIITSEARIKKTVRALEGVESEHFPSIEARDVHDLVKAHEARNFALVAKLTYAVSLGKKETRYCHYREDYPYQDDKAVEVTAVFPLPRLAF